MADQVKLYPESRHSLESFGKIRMFENLFDKIASEFGKFELALSCGKPKFRISSLSALASCSADD